MTIYKPRDPLLTVEQVAEYLEVPPSTIRNWRARNVLPPPRKIGNFVRWKLSTIEAFAGQASEGAAA